jgi:hypothetical protein
MTDIISRWQTLAPGDLPTKSLDLTFSDFNPKENLASFDFTGFVDMKELTAISSRPDLVDIAYYQDAYSAKKSSAITGQNYYGAMFFIQIGVSSIEIEDYCLRDEECQVTSM